MKSNLLTSLSKALLLSGLLAGSSFFSQAMAEGQGRVEAILGNSVFHETAFAPEWREDWVVKESTEQAPFYNYFVGSLCEPGQAGLSASVVEGVQRFKTKEAIEQYRGEFGEGLSAMTMTSPLIWQGAKASANTGEAAISQLFGMGFDDQPAFELPIRGEVPKIPKGSRICAPILSLEEAEDVLTSVGLWDNSEIKTFEIPTTPGSVSMLSGVIEPLASGVEWQLLVSGDMRETMLSLVTKDEPSVINALWDEVSSKLAPLGLQFDTKASYVNEASEYRQRSWTIPDGRWISLTYQSGPMIDKSPIGDSSILLSIYPPIENKK